MIAVHSRYFDAIPSKEDLQSVEDNISELPEVFETINLISNKIEGQISLIEKLFFEYENDVSNFNGDINEISFEKEIKRIKNFNTQLETFFGENELLLRRTNEDEIEIGVTEKYEVVYVTVNHGAGRKVLSVGIDKFKTLSPIDRPRTIFFIRNLFEISNIAKKKQNKKSE